jgi:hypothetical protein
MNNSGNLAYLHLEVKVRILLKLQMKAMIQRQNPNLQGEIHLILISIGQIMTLKIRMMICLTLRKAIKLKRTKRNYSQNEGEDSMSQVMKIDNLLFKNAEIRKK